MDGKKRRRETGTWEECVEELWEDIYGEAWLLHSSHKVETLKKVEEEKE
jgi:hypothetical protein